MSDDARAGALWEFLQSQAPRFASGEALDVVRSLGISPHEDHKTLAKRLRKALQMRGIALGYVNSLHAAARLTGNTSWHTDGEAPPSRLQFYVFDGGYQLRHSEFANWRDLADALRLWTDNLRVRGQLPLGVLTMSFTGRCLSFSVPVPKQGDAAGRNEMWSLGGVTPMLEDDHDWLADAPAALEKLRRHLEETGKAVLDGYAALKLCANGYAIPGDIDAVTASDVVNSELVLVFEPDEDDPHGGYEIARGDELTCWHQLELSLREDGTNRKPDQVDIFVPRDGVGAWLVNGKRYVWAVETLKPNGFVPGRVHRQIGPHACERLLRRYKLAKRIHSGGFRHHDFTKRVDYLSGPPDTWRVDLHRVLHMLAKADLTWDSYIEKFGVEPRAMEKNLPVGFVMQMLENLKVDNPNEAFAWPTLAEMALVTDDKLLYSLLPRVDAVRYAKPKDLDPETATAVAEAIDQFASGLNLQKMISAGAMSMENELPYLVYASDAQELRASADALGLKMYVAVSPHLIPMNGLVPEVPGVKTWPWAFGHALIVRFERQGDAQ
ncbi:hypothetical protein SNE35_29865 [Paucibacter sp. R3-3]|uniref:Uncharacterized protein n=1 Tax=Roseateles agri TaxID=3098619 RepID=A0ABU5DSH4_9BURK|nr:hypothetical protein [Paucibacter sp. R3-3]MDY0748743.1 hypothetical protein [Paucibacter sp. R3-3]